MSFWFLSSWYLLHIFFSNYYQLVIHLWRTLNCTNLHEMCYPNKVWLINWLILTSGNFVHSQCDHSKPQQIFSPFLNFITSISLAKDVCSLFYSNCQPNSLNKEHAGRLDQNLISPEAQKLQRNKFPAETWGHFHSLGHIKCPKLMQLPKKRTYYEN